jgi:NADH:ubiquinone oxidoreductase subunit 6 (subunit J)
VRGSAARAVVPALIVLGLVAVVAIAAGGGTATGTSRVRPPAATLIDTILTLGILAVVAGGVLVAYGLMQRKEIAEEMAAGRYRRTSLVGWIAFVFVFTIFTYWRLRLWKPTQQPPQAPDAFPPGQAPPPGGNPPAVDRNTYEPHIAWFAVAAVLLLVAIAVVAYVVSERRRRPPAREPALAEAVAAVLEDTLDDLRAEADPRKAVIAAYVRLEHALAAHGLPRRRAETEEEYLARMLGALEISAGAARRLTQLFERARFSLHVVDVGMKEEAIAALEDVRDELRAADAESTADELVTEAAAS